MGDDTIGTLTMPAAIENLEEADAELRGDIFSDDILMEDEHQDHSENERSSSAPPRNYSSSRSGYFSDGEALDSDVPADPRTTASSPMDSSDALKTSLGMTSDRAPEFSSESDRALMASKSLTTGSERDLVAPLQSVRRSASVSGGRPGSATPKPKHQTRHAPPMHPKGIPHKSRPGSAFREDSSSTIRPNAGKYVIESIPTSIPKPPVFCNCNDHAKTILLDRVVPIPLKTLYYLLHGDPTASFLERFLKDVKGFQDVTIAPWPSNDGAVERTIQYTIALKYAIGKSNMVRFHLILGIGPKSTRCITTQHYTRFDPERCFCIRDTATTPDVPYGTSFVTKGSQCLMRVSETETRIIVGYELEFLKTMWIKGMMTGYLLLTPNYSVGAIEKGAVDGNTSYWRDFETELLRIVDKEKEMLTAIEAKLPAHFATAVVNVSRTATPQPMEEPVKIRLPRTTLFSSVRDVGFFSVSSSMIAVCVTLLNVMFLIWIYRLNARLELLSSQSQTKATLLGTPQHGFVVPEWWLQHEGEMSDFKAPDRTTGFEDALQTYVKSRLDTMKPSFRSRLLQHPSPSSQSHSPPSTQNPIDVVFEELTHSMLETEATLASLMRKVMEREVSGKLLQDEAAG